MAYSLKKMWTAMAVTLLASTSFVGAHYDNNMYDGNCCPPSCCDNNNCCGDFWVEADALWFKADEDGLNYGSRITTTAIPGSTTHDIRTRSVDPKWEAGFRIGVGYNLPCDCWDIAVYWTRFHHKNSRHHHFTPSTTDSFAPAFGPVAGDFAVAISNARAHWKLHVDLLDVELGRDFCCSPCFTLRPFIGVRAAWIKQDFRPHYFFTDATGVETSLSDVRLKSDFDGAGIRGGLDSEWKFGCGFSIYGCAAANVLYGEQRTHFDSTSSLLTGTAIEHQRHNYKRCMAITDAAIGLRYKTCFWCDSMAVTFQLGYEHHYFWNKNRFENSITFTGDADQSFNRGDLCLHGVTFGARVDF